MLRSMSFIDGRYQSTTSISATINIKKINAANVFPASAFSVHWLGGGLELPVCE